MAHPGKGRPFKIQSKNLLTATHTIAAIQAFIAGAAANSDVAAGIAGRCIALHIFGGCVYGV